MCITSYMNNVASDIDSNEYPGRELYRYFEFQNDTNKYAINLTRNWTKY